MIKNISANKFLDLTRGDFDGWEFSDWEFSKDKFPKITKHKNYFLKTLLSFYMMFLSQFPHAFSHTYNYIY